MNAKKILDVYENSIQVSSIYPGPSVGLVDLSSDIPPRRGIWWSRVVVCHVSLTFGQFGGQADLQSGVPPGRGI